MITAVDTNVLLDVFWNDPQFGEASALALQRCMTEGSLVVCEVVWAELRAAFPTAASLVDPMATLGVVFSSIDLSPATTAGEMWRDYRSRGGSRVRLLPDFLIAAHALHQADQLLSRDHGFFRSYFPKLTIVDPMAN